MDAVIGPIRAAVEAAPDNHDLRLHLAGLLLHAGEPSEALVHAARVVAARPQAPAPALRVAERAAAASGDDRLATAYRRRREQIGDASDTVAALPQPARPSPLSREEAEAAHPAGRVGSSSDRAAPVVPLRPAPDPDAPA